MILKKLLQLFALEVSLVLVVAGDGLIFIDVVILLGQEMLESEHHVPSQSLRGGVLRVPGQAVTVTGYKP